MDLTLIISSNCPSCKRVERALKELTKKRNKVLLSVINIKHDEKHKTQIVPCLYVNQKLYSYGDINEEKLLDYLNEEIGKVHTKIAFIKVIN